MTDKATSSTSDDLDIDSLRERARGVGMSMNTTEHDEALILCDGPSIENDEDFDEDVMENWYAADADVMLTARVSKRGLQAALDIIEGAERRQACPRCKHGKYGGEYFESKIVDNREVRTGPCKLCGGTKKRKEAADGI